MSSGTGCPDLSGVLALVGPTAVGKSDVALALAERLNGEIISVDSMQVYRGMDIGTAKPDAAVRARIPHHLIDVVGIRESFDAARFVNLAQSALGEIRSRVRLPILCGGTGLYLRALLDGLGPAPAGSVELRSQLESTPLAELLHELAERDPAMYDRIDRQNPRRVQRAIEVIRLTGRPYSLQRSAWVSRGQSPARASIIGLARPPLELHSRIEARVDSMFKQGLVAETEALLQAGLAENRTAMQALGYRQVAEYLRGARSLAGTIELVKLRTRQFAKRQMTWFRHQLPVAWIELTATQAPETISEAVITLWRPQTSR